MMSEEDVWTYITDTVLPNLYYVETYSGSAVRKYDQGFMIDMFALRLGPPRLRQLRASPGK